MSMQVAIEETWSVILKDEFSKPYFADLVAFLKQEKQNNITIYPQGKDLFKAFELCPFPDVKVVILGQDPYHNPLQAHGLSFSVNDGIAAPPSLCNIFKELQSDLGIPIPPTGNLSGWAKQGILLLNASLSVRENQPMSHSRIGWHTFTDSVIQHLSEQKEKLVFLLWGKFAQSKANLIDTSKHLILYSVHPSPLSAHRGFLGCKHFSKTNDWLNANDMPTIEWDLSKL